MTFLALSLFEMLEPSVDDVFHPVQLRAPRILGVIESSDYMRAQIAQARVINEDPHQYGDSRDTNREGDLNGLIGHRCSQNTP